MQKKRSLMLLKVIMYTVISLGYLAALLLALYVEWATWYYFSDADGIYLIGWSIILLPFHMYIILSWVGDLKRIHKYKM
jgi:multisubunit Na+/H+ antiporter MnhB subunit